MSPRRLVCCVEGKGDRYSVPVLVRRLLKERPNSASGDIVVEPEPIRIGGLERITGTEGRRQEWLKKVELVTRNRKNVGAVLVVLDGDHKTIEGRPFCPGIVACELAERAKAVQAGTKFSLGCVFACKEF